jgi:hypothetical protein
MQKEKTNEVVIEANRASKAHWMVEVIGWKNWANIGGSHMTMRVGGVTGLFFLNHILKQLFLLHALSVQHR